MNHATPGLIRVSAAFVGLVILVVGLSAFGQRPSEAVLVSTFEAPDTIDAAVNFVGNDLVFEARVVRTEPARMTRPRAQATEALPALAYVPVHVVVTRVHHGALREGEETILRALGGTVDGTTYAIEGVASSDVYSPGPNVLVFAAEMVDTGDGVVAATPNWVFITRPGGRLESALDGRSIGALDAAREMIESRP